MCGVGWHANQFAISAFPIIHFVGVFRVPQRTQTVLHKNCLHVLLGLSIVFASACVCWGATNTQSALWEMWKWRILVLQDGSA